MSDLQKSWWITPLGADVLDELESSEDVSRTIRLDHIVLRKLRSFGGGTDTDTLIGQLALRWGPAGKRETALGSVDALMSGLERQGWVVGSYGKPRALPKDIPYYEG